MTVRSPLSKKIKNPSFGNVMPDGGSTVDNDGGITVFSMRLLTDCQDLFPAHPVNAYFLKCCFLEFVHLYATFQPEIIKAGEPQMFIRL